jgi:hypothetical protein
MLVESKASTGAETGALRDKTVDEQDVEAEIYYESIRNRKNPTDIKKIAKNTDFSEEEITLIRNHVFKEEHKHDDGQIIRFTAGWRTRIAWQRLEQNDIKDIDILLLKHELLELTIIKERGCSYEEAHDEANKAYNWWAEVERTGGY